MRLPYGKGICCVVLFAFLSSCALPRIIILDDPLSPEEHINLGVAYERKGETGNALAEYKKAAKRLPAAYLYMGNIHFRMNRMGEAEECYRKAFTAEPGLSDAYNNLAWLYYTKGDNLDEAESLALKALELSPANENYRDTLTRVRELKAKNKV
ncbi:MAG: tetratricopeptide repeat protein [Alphaproteobacteria bacterium]|uniref:Tetratricopeptide repeat protein n=1 Tax=Candidatus Nitrobium versatile TaxID=2884831 RepID=A0A953LWZ4_9BACT|nr:tetratricopeptide repeat protein [Candidatus Nitrobium versatile]